MISPWGFVQPPKGDGMPDLRLATIVLPSAAMGPRNPLPVLRSPEHAARPVAVDANVPISARRYLGWGCDSGCLPYLLQDGYDRSREPRPFRVAILENNVLRATFLLDFGGRLWSLWHKRAERELLYSNPVFQPGNLAVQNAWFSGGVEWNAAVPGHTPLTCSPVFAARVSADDGSPILRLYEWERIRCVPYQLDFWLPDGSEWLFVHVRLRNPHPLTIPMYWWSNIAVPEAPDVRVIAPAEAAYSFGYTGMMKRTPIPRDRNLDLTYPTNLPGSADFFYDIPEDARPWITALDGSGAGLVQTSTRQQRGRKLFAWGMGAGGRRWQEFLSAPGHPYIEIQAGVARTQYECFPLEARSDLSWTEAYGLLNADAAVVHSSDWAAARAEVERGLEERLPASELDRLSSAGAKSSENRPLEILHVGSGWGALEQRRRSIDAQNPFASDALPFVDRSLNDEQAPWIALLEHGALPETNPSAAPGAWMIQDEWRERLARSLGGRGDHWLGWLHYGVMLYAAKRPEEARQAWEQSLQRRTSAWALRNLAVLASHQNQFAKSGELYEQARQLVPMLRPLAVECLQAILAADRPARALELLGQLPPPLRQDGRIRVLEARAALDLGDLARSESILLAGHLELPDLREGEQLLSDLWYTLHEKKAMAGRDRPLSDLERRQLRDACPPPARIDFRMAITEPADETATGNR